MEVETWSQREQSLPGVCGQGLHGMLGSLHWLPVSVWHPLGVVAVSLVLGMQHGPSRVGGRGIKAHVEPSGIVPSLTNVVCSAVNLTCVPFGSTTVVSPCTKSSGVFWKHSSVRSVKLPSGSGQRRYW